MAWNRGKVDSTEITVTKEGENNNQNPIFSVFSKLQGFFNFPSPSPSNDDAVAVSKPEKVKMMMPRGQVEVPSLKLDGDDHNTNPIVLWQVYAIGGFLVVRWLVARYKEKRATKPPSDEGSPPAADD